MSDSNSDNDYNIVSNEETTDNINKNKEVNDVIDVHNEGDVTILNSNSNSDSENTREKETNDDLNINNIENLEKYDDSGNIVNKSYSMHEAFGIENNTCLPCPKNSECEDAKKEESSEDDEDSEEDELFSIISIDDVPTYILEKHEDAYEILWKISRELYCELKPESHTKYFVEHEGDDIYINELHCNWLFNQPTALHKISLNEVATYKKKNYKILYIINE